MLDFVSRLREKPKSINRRFFVRLFPGANAKDSAVFLCAIKGVVPRRRLPLAKSGLLPKADVCDDANRVTETFLVFGDCGGVTGTDFVDALCVIKRKFGE
jgi:hypothetical protein